MKYLLFVCVLAFNFQTSCKSMVSNHDQQKFKVQSADWSSVKRDKYRLLYGFNSAFRLPLTINEQEKSEIFKQGKNDVKSGRFKIMMARKVQLFSCTEYAAHILYSVQPIRLLNEEYTELKHHGHLYTQAGFCDFLHDPDSCSCPLSPPCEMKELIDRFALIFNEIQKITQKPFACLVCENQCNLTWKKVLTSLNFVVRPDMPTKTGNKDWTWYVRH